MKMYTLLYLKWLANKDLLFSAGNSAQCYVAAWMGREFGREWYVWLSPFVIHLKLTTLFVYHLYPNTKLKVFFFNFII